jgi:predicted aldo/keto reductase-like oxidoreductase
MRYKIFSERTGLKVSELALGTGMFGQAWGYGATTEEVSRIIAGFADAGGNFIDIADNYQHGVSETLVGEAITANRDDFIHHRHEVHARCLRQACPHSPGQQPEEHGPVGGSESQAAKDRSHRSLFRSHG